MKTIVVHGLIKEMCQRLEKRDSIECLLVIEESRDDWKEYNVRHLLRHTSDHNPILVNFSKQKTKRRSRSKKEKRYRFENY